MGVSHESEGVKVSGLLATMCITTVASQPFTLTVSALRIKSGSVPSCVTVTVLLLPSGADRRSTAVRRDLP